MNKGEKLLLFFLFFFGTVGIVQVDRAYSEMMDQEARLHLEFRRVDESHIRVSFLGFSGDVNGEEIQEEWSRLEQVVAETFDGAIFSVKQFLGVGKEEDESKEEGEEESGPFRTVDFPVETL